MVPLIKYIDDSPASKYHIIEGMTLDLCNGTTKVLNIIEQGYLLFGEHNRIGHKYLDVCHYKLQHWRLGTHALNSHIHVPY